ncbi:PAAR-like protein [Pendulispora rubella]|uniref:PAAR-like protein n=1 Tax=Pendulispora rubella TaxID=2741070 RepID=UPI00374E1E49
MKLAVDGDQLRCSYGTLKARLTVLPGTKESAGSASSAPGSGAGAALATVSDHLSPGNIGSFGECSAPKNPAVKAALGAPQPCIPVTLKAWTSPHSNVGTHGVQVLVQGATCECEHGGNITVVEAGKARVGVGPNRGEAWRGPASHPALRTPGAIMEEPPLDGTSDSGSRVTLRIFLRDEHERPIPSAPYRLRASGVSREGVANSEGLLVEDDISLEGGCHLEWGTPENGEHGSYRFTRTLKSEHHGD